jgi:lipopolysaccharide export system protein LptA
MIRSLHVLRWVLLTLLVAGPVRAQLQDRIQLTATNAVLEFQEGVYHLWDHVRVESSGVLTLTCDDLRAVLPQDKAAAAATVAPGAGGSGRLQSLVATGHVQIQFFQAGAGGTTNVVYASGDKAEYGAADEVLILTGNPRIETGSGTMVGTEALIYDLKSRSMRNRGPYRIELRSDVLRNSVLFNRGTNAPKSR